MHRSTVDVGCFSGVRPARPPRQLSGAYQCSIFTFYSLFFWRRSFSLHFLSAAFPVPSPYSRRRSFRFPFSSGGSFRFDLCLGITQLPFAAPRKPYPTTLSGADPPAISGGQTILDPSPLVPLLYVTLLNT
jgi:hypothetical protein